METDVKHPGWCGAERATIGAAEMTAVLKALVWISALLTFVHNFLFFLSVVFFTDRMDTIDIIEGRKVESSHPWLVSITKFFHMWVSCRLRLSFQHVPSHTRLKWNDVVDEDAKSLLDGESAYGLNLNLVHASLGQFTGSTPTMELADYLSGVKVKRMASLVLLDQAVPDTFQSSCRVRRKQLRQSCTRTSLTWATANVLTLNLAKTRHPRASGLGQSARSSLLQAQFSKAGVDIVGVQEARMESSQRTAALFHVWSPGAAPGGHLGCELWISVSCGIAPTEVTVAQADPRRLVCSVASPAFQGAIAVLHAPVDQGEDGDFTW